MALTIYENKGASPSKVKIDRRLYTNVAGKLVEDGDKSAVELYTSAGKFVNRADFEARGGVVEDEPEASDESPPVPPPPKNTRDGHVPAKTKAAKTSKKGS